jgi:type II secretory pathway pseudopilin PulG
MRWLSDLSRRTRRTGFSMIELLVGIGIVLAVAAIAVPWTMGWLGRRELDNAEDGLTMQMMMARAAAREEGRPVEVVAEFDGTQSRINARWMLGAGGESARRSSRRDPSEFSLDGSPSDGSIDASWASMQLPRGVRIALGLERADSAEEVAVREDARADDAVAANGQTLAIFLPDGTVFFAPIFMLRTDAGSLRAMKVDRATGVPQQVAQPRASSGSSDRPEFDAPASEFDGADAEFSGFDGTTDTAPGGM